MTQLAPNDLLREARKSRRLSREKLGEQIGTSGFTIGRWERGETLPDAYYVARLAMFFQLRPEALGLPAFETQTLVPNPALYDTAIPTPSTIPLVGREQELTQIKQHLYANGNSGLTALNGLPGVGKTALATVLSHDEEIRTHFANGILWAALGPEPNFPALFTRWGKMLGFTAREIANMDSSEAWAKAIHSAIGTRHMLLVLDDAWHIEDVLLLKVGGPHCTHLVTTRFPNIATHIAADGATIIKELNTTQSMELLRLLAPQVMDHETQKALDLVNAVGGLPLALTLLGNYLRIQAHNGQARRIHAALERLSDAEERLHITAPRGPVEVHPSLPNDKPLSLQSIIAVTDQQLSEPARHALYALAVFPAKPNSFSEEAVLAVTQCSEEILDELADTGLLESAGGDRYTLHQTIADYSRTHLTDTSVYDRLLEYVNTYVETHPTDYEELERESSIILRALEIAYEQGRQEELVRGVKTFTPFLLLRGLYTPATLHVQRAHEAALALDDQQGVILTLLYLGQIANKRETIAEAASFFQDGLARAQQSGNHKLTSALLTELASTTWRQGAYTRAASYAKEGLVLARQIDDQKRVGALLKTLGSITASQGDYQQSENYLREGLELARQSGDRGQICASLLNLGVTLAERGEYDLSETCLEEGLVLARQIGHLENICLLLINLAEINFEHKAYAQAEAYLLEGLQLARQIRHREWTSVILLNLAEQNEKQGNYERVEEYLRESMELAETLGRPRIISCVFYEYGMIYLKQKQIEQAETNFRQMLAVTPEEDHEMHALAQYGLACVAAERGDLQQAHQLGEESISTLETMGHRRALELRQWLTALQ